MSQEKKVLVIDDDSNICQILTVALSSEGHQVRAEKDGRGGLETFREFRPDLILLDVLLPEVNGFEVCKSIRESPLGATIPIIMMSAIYKTSRHHSEARHKYGATDYINKPFQLPSLVEKITGYLETGGDPYQSRTSAEGQVKTVDSGVLKKTPFYTILGALSKMSVTGRLRLSHGNARKKVYFRDGIPISVESNLLKECLGELLLSQGKISKEMLDDSLTLMKIQQKQLGMILVEMGVLQQNELKNLFLLQAKEKLLEIFQWPDGEFIFEPDRAAPDGIPVTPMDVAHIIFEGVVKFVPLQKHSGLLEHYSRRYVVLNLSQISKISSLPLAKSQIDSLYLMDGTSLFESLPKVCQVEPSKLQSTVAALYLAGLLDFKATGQKVDLQALRDALGEKEAAEGVEEQELEELPPEDILETDPSMIRKFLERRYQGVSSQDHFEILGIPRDADTNTIKSEYFKLAKIYHPDRHFRDVDDDVKKMADEVFASISMAYEVLQNEQERKSYRMTLDDGFTDASDQVEAIVQAEQDFQKGKVFLRGRNFKEAEQCFIRAIERNPKEAEFHAYLGWAAYNKPGESKEARIAKSKKHLDQALKIREDLDTIHLFLGHIAKAQGYIEDAMKEFKRAINLNRDCTDAVRELRLLSMRKEKEKEKKKGILGKFFKDK